MISNINFDIKLMKEGHASGCTKEIMQITHGINITKRGIRTIIQKYITGE